MARRRHLSRKQIAAGFGGKRAKSSSRRSAPRKHRRRSYARNPVAAVAAAPRSKRRRSRRSAATVGRYIRRRTSKAGGMISGVVTRDIVPAAIGGAGALALDMLWPHLTFLPPQLQTGPIAPFTRIAGALAIGVVGGMIAGRRFGTMMTIGAMVPTFYDIGKGYIAAAAPTPPPQATASPATHGYAPLGWASPARLAGYAPLDGYAPVDDYASAY